MVNMFCVMFFPTTQPVAALYYRDFAPIFSRAFGVAACTIVIFPDFFLT